jgi:hypothetical protein
VIFTRIGSVIAWVLVALGAFRTALGFLLAFGADDSEAAARALLAAANTGEAINEGMLAILAGVVVGVLVEISKSVAQQ